jgi:hypothetical protein
LIQWIRTLSLGEGALSNNKNEAAEMWSGATRDVVVAANIKLNNEQERA